MIKIAHAQVEILDKTQARPVGKTVLSVTIGDHVFDIQVDESELIDALASEITSEDEDTYPVIREAIRRNVGRWIRPKGVN